VETSVVFHNGTAVTMDETMPTAEAVLIRDGRVAEVGGPDLKGPQGARVVDLGGRTLVPGFIDAHNHFSFSAFEPEMIDCSTPPLESLGQVLDEVARRCATIPDGVWVRAWGFHSSQVRERRNPTRRELDEAAPANPFVLLDVSFHACYVNSVALRTTGISRNTPDPPLGSIERDSSGEPTGTLRESACDLPQRDSWLAYAAREPDLAVELIERQCGRFLALGITGVGDALVTPQAADLYARAHRAARLPISISQLHGGDTFFGRPKPDRGDVDLHQDDPALRGGMIKMFMDASYPSPAIDRFATDDSVESLGMTCFTPEEATQLALLAADNDLGIAIHCGGNRAVDHALEAFAAVRRRHPSKDITLRVEHAFVGARDQPGRMSELGVRLVTQPGLAQNYGHLFSAMRGEDQPQLVLFPAAGMVDAGVTVAASSDYPCGGGLAPLEIMSAAVNRRRTDGELIDPDEAVGRERALRMYTLDAARACDRDAIEGSISPGKRANLVVLDRNPSECDPVRTSVVQTWVDGELRYDALDDEGARSHSPAAG
jgi:predicted amidohydrolase YtcJ